MARKNNNLNPQRSLSQKKRILMYLQTGARLTPGECWLKIGSSKLATRISELINKDGHTEIQKQRVYVKTADGDVAQVMSYYIDPACV